MKREIATHQQTLTRHAFIGLGRICSLLEKDPLREKPCTHAGAVASLKGARISAGCDSEYSRRLDFCKTWSIAECYSDYREMLKKEPVDILHITTPPALHVEMLEKALEQQVPVIVCEKPAAESLEDVKRIRDALKAHPESRVMINHERRFSADYIHARKQIAAGKAGTLLSLRGSILSNGKERAEEILLHDGTHLIDAIHFLTSGELCNGQLIGQSDQKNTLNAAFSLTLPVSNQDSGLNEIPCLIQAGSLRNYFEFSIEMDFTNGRLRIGNGFYEWQQSRPSPHYRHFRSLKKEKPVRFRKTGYFINMVKEARRLFEDPNALPVSPIEEGCRTVELILDLLGRESLNLGGREQSGSTDGEPAGQ